MIFMMQTYGKIELGKNIFHCLGWQQCLTENTYQQKSVEKYSKASYFWSKSGPQLMCFESQISTIWWISVHWCKRCFNSLGNFAYVIKHLVLREMFQDFFIFRKSFTIPQIRLQVIAPPFFFVSSQLLSHLFKWPIQASFLSIFVQNFNRKL